MFTNAYTYLRVYLCVCMMYVSVYGEIVAHTHANKRTPHGPRAEVWAGGRP